MTLDDIGYNETALNGTGIKRARTSKQIRSWSMKRSLKCLHALNEDMGNVDFPGLYILFEGDKRVYIGEAKSIVKRLDTHNKTPEEKIKNWDNVTCFNDGRPATQSDFNDEVVSRITQERIALFFQENEPYH